jgi:hypothetical protein
MSFSLSARKFVVCWCSLVAIPLVTLSQNSFVASGGEYSITGKLPGDQVHPQVSFTTNGGYIVWEDYWMDGKGLGVGAMRLKNDLTGSGSPFRVDSLVAGDQEDAQVSILNNGGAAFGWQGGKQGFQHVYSRFLSSSNNWVTGDVPVNSATNRFQSGLAMATLLNGNVAIVYGSYNQAGPGSMLDIYLQLFSPTGSKIGSEIQVNQFTANNQRGPTIAALADGRFVVGWVSEQQRWTDASNGVPSVDIYARVFGSSGAPVANEFLINAGNNICSAPDLTATADGGFMAAWMEKDLAVRNNGWDIYARRFTSVGVGGDVTRVNTQLYGDQYAPKIRRSGSTYLVVWTSMGEDGSREGVYGSYLNDDATVSGNEFLVNTTVAGSQMHQALGSDGAGRLFAAWTGFGAGVTGFDLYGQKYADPAGFVVGTNNTAFNSDPNTNLNSVYDIPPGPVITPPADPGTNSQTGSVTNTFADVKGTYNGLVYDANGISTANSGYITITTSAKGAQGGFSAKLQMGGSKYSFSGSFDATGAYSGTVNGLTISLLVDLHGGDRITGQITDGNWTASLQANRIIFSKTHPSSLAGAYTIVVQPADETMGNGIGTLTVDTSGNVKWNLVLPDGTKMSAATTLSKSGAWPLYAQPYTSGGVAIGWMQFGSTANDGFSGLCAWTKPGGVSRLYSGGLTNGLTVTGSLYKAPPVAFHTFGRSKVILNGGGLSAPITNGVTWGIDNKIVPDQGSSSLKLSLNASSGLFQGTVATGSGKGQTLSFQGVLFEKNNAGLGLFLGPDQSGTVIFVPNP